MHATLPSLLPLPRQVELLPGSCELRAGTRVVAGGGIEMAHVADHLVADLQARLGLHVRRGDLAEAGDIELRYGPTPHGGAESYVLHLDHRGVRLTAPSAPGLWNGTRTLLQLLPAAPALAVELPAVRIVDAPRLAWRGAMLDVARHFFGVDHVKRFIELVAGYKMNRLHLHLTDDQGWRLEIPRYPELTAIGGAGAVGGAPGGWYSLDDWWEICQHAARHHVTVVPEVDLPGHVHAALASLPQLSADGVAPAPYTGQRVIFSSLDLSLPATHEFADEVVRTLALATPGRILHIGGDEATSTAKEDYHAFIARMQRVVHSHDCTMMGWEEVATASLGEGSIVQHWLSAETALATPPGCTFVMSPAPHTYLDMRHADGDALGRGWAGAIDVDRAYQWNPSALVPGVDDDRIEGVEAPLWTERVQDFGEVEQLCFPRLLCLAEVGWTPQRLRSWPEFSDRLADHTDALALRGVHVHRSRLLRP